DLGEEQRPPLARPAARQLEDLAARDGPPRERRVAVVALVVRPPVGQVVTVRARQELPLVEPVAVARREAQHLLQAEQVRRERLDARADRDEALLPGAEAVPDVERRDAQRLHGPHPQVMPFSCSSSQRRSGAKYSSIGPASAFRPAPTASIASGHGLLAPNA